MKKLILLTLIVATSILLNAQVKKEYYKSGKLKEVGNYKNGKKDGQWKSYHENGQLGQTGNYINGEMIGKVKTYYENGQLEGIVNLVAPQSGTFKEYYRNGKLKSEGEYLNGELTGFYKRNNKDGNLLESGIYKADKKIGNWKINKYYKNGKLEEESILLGKKKNGDFKSYYENGQLKLTAIFKNGKGNGEFKFYFKDGTLRKVGTSKNGNVERKGNYTLGKRSGEWSEYYDNGKIEKVGSYKVVRKGSYSTSEKDGYWKEYGENGKLNEKGRYSIGKKEGPWEYFYNKYDRYFLSSKGSYANGEKEGEWYSYNRDNTQRKIYIYQNGNLIEIIKDGKENIVENGYRVGEKYYKNNRLIKTIKFIIENNKKVGEETWVDGVLTKTNRYNNNPTEKDNKIYNIYFKNKNNITISLLVRLLNSKNKWQTMGWYNIKPGKDAYIGDTENSIVYYYAEGGNGKWSGSNYRNFKGKRYGFAKWVIKKKGGGKRRLWFGNN